LLGNVSGEGPDSNTTALDNRQRGFDFYSWLTFIVLNSPANGNGIETSKPDTQTKWEDGKYFKSLLDVMVEEVKAPQWEVKDIPPGGAQATQAGHDGRQHDRGKLQPAVQDWPVD
jgi:hypothetical protein